ncbi:MAG TPA: cyclic nucleotide-binding domain-containing protein [Candidatus Margulisiibacteriota bacterium]|nr:cyclic nucleotide-binding domain-containing protein [Candidatus Margulisiibacteriota bacterium]
MGCQDAAAELTWMPSDLHIALAETEEEKRAVYRFRYRIYVEEMGKYRSVSDHTQRLFSEPEDARSRIFYATENGEVVATARSTWGGDAPLPQRMIEQYQLGPFLAEVPESAIAVGERGMVVPRLRGTDLFLRLIGASLRFANEHRIQLCFGDCEPHLLNLYLGLGQRTYSKKNVNSAEAGYLIPIVFVPEDVAYLRRINSPLLEYVKDFGSDARIPPCVERLTGAGTAVMSRRLVGSADYWGEVHGALSQIEGTHPTALDGLTDEEAVRCLDKSNIIECRVGDRLLKKGGVARNLFVVLDGTVEVRDGDTPLAVFGPGDVFGEMAFLLERPRSQDVYAATDGVRVLSLSEATLRQLIKNDPASAAHLLLNIAKMLCLRILKAH